MIEHVLAAFGLIYIVSIIAAIAVTLMDHRQAGSRRPWPHL